MDLLSELHAYGQRAVVIVLSLPFLAVLAIQPIERRLALRYPLRRPLEGLLVVLGSLLGTAIITGSLVVGDTIDRSIRASAYEQLGTIDEVIAVSGLERGDEVAGRFRDYVDMTLAQNSGFFTLMQQFVGVGLIVGIAGIGVLLVRAVRERRREIGVLRALGFRAPVVSHSFLVEAGFIAAEGVAIGVLVALVGSYGLVASGDNFAEGFQWAVPWNEVAVIIGIALVASTAIALWPARRAAHIRPAIALRIAD